MKFYLFVLKLKLYLDKAQQVADLLLPAFDTPTGIPHALIVLSSGASKNWNWAAGGCSILSELGTMHLEFQYLSQLTGKDIYLQKVFLCFVRFQSILFLCI